MTDSELVALVDRVEALESRIEALRPRLVGTTARVVTYFAVLTTLTVSVVDRAYLLPWMAGALTVALIPEAMRLRKRRALARERDRVIQEGTGTASLASGTQ